MNRQFVCLIVCFLLVSSVLPVIGTQPSVIKIEGTHHTSHVLRGDTSDWPMIRHDPAHTGTSLTKAPSHSTVLWNRSVGFPATSSPLEYANLVYVSSSDGVLYCLDAQTGATVWASPQLNSTLPSDAGIANDKVYLSADKLYCFDALNGTQLWNQTLGANGRSPTLAQDNVYIGAEQVYCFDGNNGSMRWNFSLGNTSFFTSPAVTNDVVFAGDIVNAQLYSLNASTGTMNWNVSLSSYNPLSTAPVIADGRVYLCTVAGELLCFDASNGNLSFVQPIGDQIHSSPAIWSGHLYFGCNNTYVYCLDALTGAPVWGFPTGGPVNSSPAVADGKVLGSSDQFYCFDALTGSQLWSYPTSGGVSSPAIANGTVYVCGNDQQVYCFTESYPPDAPTIPVGPMNAASNIPLNFSTVTTDFEGDQISYWWDWGEGNHTDWIGPFNPNEPMTANYSWVNNGTYSVRVKAKDSAGHESAWSEPLTVSIARQISIKPYKIGFIYFRFFMFNNSYFYSQLLLNFGLAVIITNRDLIVSANASTAVHSVIFTVFSPTYNESLSLQDDNGTDGFSCAFNNITSGFYGIILDAYDANGNLIDHSVFTLLYFWRFGSPAGETLHSAFQGHHLLHRSSYFSLQTPQRLNRKESYFH
jgi:outer membrane protein assembly factor BamB